VFGDEEGPPFVYTAGLSGFGHPELIMFAISRGTGASMLNELGELVRSGDRIEPGQRIPLHTGIVNVVPSPRSEKFLLAANSLYRAALGGPAPALLVVPEDGYTELPSGEAVCPSCS
jgi:hypothetical protein